MTGDVMVTVNVSNSSTQDAANIAAQAISDAVANLESQLGKMNATTTISYGAQGQSITVGDLLKEIRNTEFVITDQNYTSLNGGVGSAGYHTDGIKNQDFLNYHAFDGSPGSYNDPYYTNGQGMNFILLHELAHLSDSGNASTGSNEKFYLKDNPSDTSYSHYTDSDYYVNNEEWANDFSRDLGNATGIDESHFSPTYGYGSHTALSIYQSHHASTNGMPNDYLES